MIYNKEGEVMSLNTGRFTTIQEEGVTVFIIGMRINKWRAIKDWVPVMMAFPDMIKELEANKHLGYMNGETFITGRTIISVQYWKSEAELLGYAKNEKHLKAWKQFNRKAREAGNKVGLYHETHIIEPGRTEAVYINMPDFALGKTLGTRPITKEMHTAKMRLDRKGKNSS
ncbi:uncharacterized protein DUF4188 [Salinicoccus kekensis]|uniref:Uncharacterized protein DUF4188 n=2 Tax=Salinicoccus kekensis TaxID=714307 RepID=A0A285UNQ5_9STAP|nr:uncharacterized protein DUF4188 [Salinicoccus kekensis]